MSKAKNLIVVFSLSVVFLFLTYLIIGKWFTDDAFISFRYANNFISGNGLVYNVGENVQGYTNFLWIFLLSGFKMLNFDYTVSSLFINVLSYLLLVYTFYLIAKREFYNSNEKIIFSTLLFASSPNLLIWSVGGGLEGPLFSFLCLISLYNFITYKSNVNLILGVSLAVLATLCRPEGLLFFLFGLFYLLINDKLRKSFKVFIFLLLSYLLLLTPYLIWLFWYYGDIIPNTFYAKVSANFEQLKEGFRYSYRFFMSISLSSLFLFLAVKDYKTHSTFTKYCINIFIIYLAYIVGIGGDFMFSYRFFIPIMPFFIFVVISSIFKLPQIQMPEESKKVKSGFVFIMFLIISYNLLSLSFLHKTEIKNYSMIENGEITANYFNNNFPHDNTIALSAIGAFGFYSKMKILDVLGLTNKEIALSKVPNNEDHLYSHNRSNAKYVLDRKPDIILFGMPLGEALPVRYAEIEIYNHKFFKEHYLYTEEILSNNLVIKYYLLKK